MKKLMIALTIVVATTVSQAAQIKWSFSSAANEDAYAGSTFYLIAASALPSTDNLSSKATVDALIASALDQKDTTKNAGTKKYLNGKESLDLTTITKDKSYYLLVVNSDESKVKTSQLIAGAEAVYDTKAQESQISTPLTLSSTWTTVNVPEPTSGLMLLLGIAGLALRRKQK